MANLFVVFSPEGLFYYPLVTLKKSRALIEERSLYPGEPGWEVVPEDADFEAVRERIRVQKVARHREQFSVAGLEARHG
ncbi:TPA: hypothetical protein QDB06_001747 [Burkholderia vietnamiensis]|uniref:hypothetical protein n=1 Tax=Burkholderia vietnamiensis TaxID=60552 RepID=UPI00158ABEA9|nr:hypothetical protein [Burkholderia vietnamiensis]MCA7958050.1 hypothetical protein [Burkholderia multivorans]HDR9159706.1 hypothetical protein [Burkholderia vietnamiensis]HDR9181193.1 hypothetical protein [Burkholderia vietnamiensis]